MDGPKTPTPMSTGLAKVMERARVHHRALTRRIQGHFNYFGVNGNLQCLSLIVEETKRSWYKWLNRRSQRSRLNWKRFGDLLRDFPLPRPRVYANLWAIP